MAHLQFAMPRIVEIFLTFLRLGCTSFGGPVAHLAYFEAEFVRRKRWLAPDEFGECIAITQMLPGPASSQTGMLVGWLAGGPLGAVAAWLGFTLPSAVLMTLVAMAFSHGISGGWMHGLLLVACAAVASAVVTMRSSLAPDLPRIALAIAVAAFVLLAPIAYATIVAILFSALFGAIVLHGRVTNAGAPLRLALSKRAGIAFFAAFAGALVVLAAVASHGSHLARLANALFQTGSLVFGGGHVVLPLLQQQVARSGLVSADTITTGYAAAQAMPGPLFSIAAFVGATSFGSSLGWVGASVGTVAIFAPSFLLLGAIAPFYAALGASVRFRAALAGANAGVVGLLAATFCYPIVTSAVHSSIDGACALLAFVALHFARIPAWIVVSAGALAGYFLGRT